MLPPKSFPIFNHDIGNLNIFFCLVLCGDFEDDVLLVLGNRLPADCLEKLAHPIASLAL